MNKHFFDADGPVDQFFRVERMKFCVELEGSISNISYHN